MNAQQIFYLSFLRVNLVSHPTMAGENHSLKPIEITLFPYILIHKKRRSKLSNKTRAAARITNIFFIRTLPNAAGRRRR